MQLQIWYLSINSTVKKSAFSLKGNLAITTQGKIIPNLNLQANQIGDGKPIARNLCSNFNLITCFYSTADCIS